MWCRRNPKLWDIRTVVHFEVLEGVEFRRIFYGTGVLSHAATWAFKRKCKLPEVMMVETRNLQISKNSLEKLVTREPTVRYSKTNPLAGTKNGDDGDTRQNLRRSDPNHGT